LRARRHIAIAEHRQNIVREIQANIRDRSPEGSGERARQDYIADLSNHDNAQADLGGARRRNVILARFKGTNGIEGRIGLDRMIDLRAASV
jgi:hypothetical protein